jgi:O-antigen ligase
LRDFFHRAFIDDDGSGPRFSTANAAALALFLVAIPLVPLPYGAILPPATFRLEIAAFALAGAAALSTPAMSELGASVAPVVLLAAIALEGVVQLLPLPAVLLDRWSPVSEKIYHDAAGIFSVFGRSGAPTPCISIAPWETRGTILLVGALLAVFFSAAALLQTRRRRRLFLAAILASAVIQIGLGAAATEAGGRTHGTFVNPDHFAGYLEIALALAFGLIWAEVLQGSDRARGVTDRGERFEKRFPPIAWRVLLWGFIATGIVLTKSRGGIAAAALTTIVLLSLAVSGSRGRTRGRSAVVAIPALIFGALFVVAATHREILLRFLASDPRDIGSDMRVAIWKTSIRAWRTFPLFGSGLGTFREAFRRAQPRGLAGLVEQAHNDFLQLLVTGGAIGAALGALAFGFLLWNLLRGARAQQHREESAIALAGFGALLSLVLHGLVDFNMSIPAIPATLAAVLGCAWAAATDPRERHRSPADGRIREVRG